MHKTEKERRSYSFLLRETLSGEGVSQAEKEGLYFLVQSRRWRGRGTVLGARLGTSEMGRKEVVGPIIVKVYAVCWFLLCTIWGRQSFKELNKMDQYNHLLDQ